MAAKYNTLSMDTYIQGRSIQFIMQYIISDKAGGFFEAAVGHQLVPGRPFSFCPGGLCPPGKNLAPPCPSPFRGFFLKFKFIL